MGPVISDLAGKAAPLLGRDHAVLVVDCKALGMIAVVRSLGRAGYKVHAVSSDRDALGFHSSFCSVDVCHPPYADASFLPWLQDYVQCNRIAAIIPSEAFSHAIRSEFEKYRSLILDAAPVSTREVCLSKVAAQRPLLESGAHSQKLPRGCIITIAVDNVDLPELGRHIGPFYLKADSGHGIDHKQATVVRCEDAFNLLSQIELLRPRYIAWLWQSFALGVKVGVNLWRHHGAMMAGIMVLGLRMMLHRRTF